MHRNPETLIDREVISRLKWAWSSTPLLDPMISGESRIRSLQGSFDRWDAAAARFLELHSQRRTHRLGETFELLIRSIFDVHPEVHRVIPNLILPDGEIDLLFSSRERPNDYIAIELAVKFYLFDACRPDANERWIGPARRDFLFRKVRRVFDLQVPRASLHQTLYALKAIDPLAERITDTLAFLRGELFARPRDQELAHETLRLLPVFHRNLTFSPVLSSNEAMDSATRPLRDRWNWICSASDARADDAMDSKETDLRAEMVLVGTGGSTQCRAFVTPEGWADRQL